MSEKPQMHNYIPAWHAQALWNKLLLELAESEGYSPEELEKIRQMLATPREPVLVSLDDIYGKEE